MKSPSDDWFPLAGFEGRYEITKSGLLRSVQRTVVRRNGSPCPVRSVVLKGQISGGGYVNFKLRDSDGKYRHFTLHRLLAQTFIPNPEGKPFVCHLDDVKTNNDLSNLYWGTKSDNSKDAVRNGRHGTASRTHCAKGHEFNEENTYVSNSSVQRKCKICMYNRTHQDLGLDDPRHSSYAGYMAGCRCDGCRDAKRYYARIKAREYRARKKQSGQVLAKNDNGKTVYEIAD